VHYHSVQLAFLAMTPYFEVSENTISDLQRFCAEDNRNVCNNNKPFNFCYCNLWKVARSNLRYGPLIKKLSGKRGCNCVRLSTLLFKGSQVYIIYSKDRPTNFV
jgi:hypothetical protein